MMKKVLYVEASPRKSRSASIEVATTFLEALKRNASVVEIDVMDLWSLPLPEFDGAALEAKYAGLEGRQRTPEQEGACQAINALGDRFKAANLLVFSVPMWNFGIPYKLKHLIDVVSQKDVLFTFDERGLNGMMTTTRAVCIYARGVAYTAESGFAPEQWDHQRPFLEAWLRSVGVSTIDSILVEKTVLGPEPDRQSRDEACWKAQALAANLAR
jgi:FMN-dependent NADH-azoreductase